jgi:hypothetical protein
MRKVTQFFALILFCLLDGAKSETSRQAVA